MLRDGETYDDLVRGMFDEPVKPDARQAETFVLLALRNFAPGTNPNRGHRWGRPISRGENDYRRLLLVMEPPS